MSTPLQQPIAVGHHTPWLMRGSCVILLIGENVECNHSCPMDGIPINWTDYLESCPLDSCDHAEYPLQSLHLLLPSSTAPVSSSCSSSFSSTSTAYGGHSQVNTNCKDESTNVWAGVVLGRQARQDCTVCTVPQYCIGMGHIICIVIWSIPSSTVDCNCTTFRSQRSLSDTKQFGTWQTFVVVTLYNYNLLCYVKCSTSLLPFKAVAMSLYHIIVGNLVQFTNAVHTYV